jgi:micrococcal nuclease
MKISKCSVGIILMLAGCIGGLCSGAAGHAASSEQWFLVEWVNDGDTIILSDGRRVRYIGINTPELVHEDQPAEPFSQKAYSCNRKLVQGKKVRFEKDQQLTDAYGRTLAYVFLKDGTLVNATLVQAGYAYCLYVKPNARYYLKLRDYQREAMRQRKGMWKFLPDQDGHYIGNIRSRRFHNRSCHFGKKIQPSRRMVFDSLWDAFYEGYAPCQRCRPFMSKLRIDGYTQQLFPMSSGVFHRLFPEVSCGIPYDRNKTLSMVPHKYRLPQGDNRQTVYPLPHS